MCHEMESRLICSTRNPSHKRSKLTVIGPPAPIGAGGLLTTIRFTRLIICLTHVTRYDRALLRLVLLMDRDKLPGLR